MIQRLNSNETAAAAATLDSMQKQNPANLGEKTVAERKRVPMTAPTRKLEIAELPGYWLQWIRGTPDRVMQAKNAGFEHVYEKEVHLNNMDLGGDAKTSGNTDMGSIVSTTDGSGEIGSDGQGVRLYLMKQKKEHHDEDTELLQTRNDSVVDSLTANFRKGTVGVGAEGAPTETPQDQKLRYVGNQSKVPDLFRRKA